MKLAPNPSPNACNSWDICWSLIKGDGHWVRMSKQGVMQPVEQSRDIFGCLPLRRNPQRFHFQKVTSHMATVTCSSANLVKYASWERARELMDKTACWGKINTGCKPVSWGNKRELLYSSLKKKKKGSSS